MKIAKFIAYFLAAATLIFAIIISVNFTAFKAVFTDREAFAEGSEWIERTYSLAGLVEYMEANPEHISAVSLNPANPNDILTFNELEKRPLGALSNIFLIMEYANQVNKGTISPETPIPLDDIARFVVPGWYEAAHRNALKNIQSENNRITLHEVVLLASRHYSQAASDFLFFYLGDENVHTLINSLGEESIEPYIPGAGIQIGIILKLDEMSADDAVQFYKKLSTEDRIELFTEYARRFNSDDMFRDEISQRAPTMRERKLSEERAIHALWSRAEPLAFTNVMASLFRGEFVDQETSAMVTSFLTWASEDPIVRQHTTFYGALFESRLGYLSALDMGTSVYTNQSYIQTVFFADLPIAFWLHMSSNFMNHEYQRRLIYDPEMRRVTDLASRQEYKGTNAIE